MADTNAEKKEPVFYATFDDPGKEAINEWKKSLGAVERSGTNKDGTQFVSLHTDKARFVRDPDTRACAWKIRLDALNEAGLEERFANVKYYARQSDALESRNPVPMERIAAAVKASQKPDWLKRVEDFKFRSAGSVTSEDVAKYVASQARYLGGFTSKPFSGNIQKFVGGDLLFQKDLGGTRARELSGKLAAISADLINAAVDGRKAREGIQEMIDRAGREGNKGTGRAEDEVRGDEVDLAGCKKPAEGDSEHPGRCPRGQWDQGAQPGDQGWHAPAQAGHDRRAGLR